MKKIFVSFLFSIVLTSIYSQENIVKISPLVFTKGQILEVHYERHLFGRFTAGAGISTIFFSSSASGLEYKPEKFNIGVAIDPEIRYYFKKKNDENTKPMDGYFMGLYNSTRISSYTSYDSFENPNSTTLNKINENISIYGLQFGYEKKISENLIIDLYTGFGSGTVKYLITNTITNQSMNTTKDAGNFRFNFSIGYSF